MMIAPQTLTNVKKYLVSLQSNLLVTDNSQIIQLVPDDPDSPRQRKPLNPQVFPHAKSIGRMNSVNEDSLVDLTYEKNLTKISYDKMKQSIQAKNVTKPDGSLFTCWQACCKFSPGYHTLTSSSLESDATRFGVGITLYFKFIKHLIYFFIIAILLSVPALCFYIAAFSSYNTANQPSYLDLLTATTLGSVGLGSSSCGVARYPDSSSGSSSQTSTMQFKCKAGKIADVSNIVFGLVTLGSTCRLVQDSEIDTQCNRYDSTDLQNAFQHCVGEASCSFAVPSSIFLPEANHPDCSQLYNLKNIYMRVTCDSHTFDIFGGKEIEKTTVAHIITALDATTTLLLLFMVYSLQYAQKSTMKNQLKQTYSAASFSLQIKGLPQGLPAERTTSLLWNLFDEKLGNKDELGIDRVVDVQIVLPNRLIGFNKKIGEIVSQKNTMMRAFIELYEPSFEGTTIKFNDITQILTKLRQNSMRFMKNNYLTLCHRFNRI